MSSAQALRRPRPLAGLLLVGVVPLSLPQQYAGGQSVADAILAVAAGLAAAMLLAGWFGSAGQLLVSLLCSLSLAEFLVPLVLYRPADQASVQYAPGYWMHGDLGSVPSEGRFRADKSTPAGGTIYDVPYIVGADRFRVTPTRPVAAVRLSDRVNFLGCSVTYGEGLEDDQTLPASFAQQAGDVQAHNFAFHGYGAHQALAILQSDRDTAGRVNVFVTAPWHALRSACKPIWTLGSPRFERDPNGSGVRRAGQCGDVGGLIPMSVARGLAQSALYRVVRGVIWEHANDADLALYLALVREMAQVSHARGQRFVVGFIKADERFFQQTSFSNRRLLEAITREVDEVVDLTLSDRAETVDRRHYLHELDRHPSAEANRARAKLLVERLKPYLAVQAANGLSPSP